ncbi:MAG: class I SAM-dependent methyltransferase [Aestuariivirga sp.]|nr:class I SAM-dependent methyltransferase [Aestuariivirga sp.]
MNIGFEEDLAENLRLTEELAPLHCTDCDGYHLERAHKRYAAGLSQPLDQPELTNIIHDILAKHFDRTSILIAGSADTNLLSICCMAAERIRPGTARRIEFTVVDKCETPLQLCEAFARHNHLHLATRVLNLSEGGLNIEADIILAHSLLRFMPEERHRQTMESFRRCLKPGGTLVYSQRLFSRKQERGYNKSEYSKAEDLERLFKEAELSTRFFQQIDSAPHAETVKRRLIYLLAPEERP